MAAANVLIIDDDPAICDSCQEVLRLEGHQVEQVRSGEDGLRRIADQGFDLVFLDLKMPGLGGMEVLRRAKEEEPDLVVVVITGYGTVEAAIEAMKLGAFDFLLKPFTPDQLRVTARRAIDVRRLALQNRLLKEELETHYGRGREPDVLLGDSEAMTHVRDLVRRAGPTDSTILLLGETGTGKEVVARLIHQCSRRQQEPMLVVDCGSLVETLFESELFGHTKGSFTGAIATKYGRFELANGGTLVFDEIGNVGPTIQSKLLRAIQEREIMRVGGNQPIKVDVRIIAATNRDIVAAVRDGSFREDLFYRLSVVPIHIPPLRERKSDVPLLARHFLDKHARRQRKEVRSLSDTALATLNAYDWPGNVRELEAVIERAVVLTDKPLLEPPDLVFFGQARRQDGPDGTDLRSLDAVEAEHIAGVLRAVGGHLSRAAEILGINRKTLRLKMLEYGIPGTRARVAEAK